MSLDHYRRESTKIIQMFKEGLPGGEIERASIDEAFIDFTRPVREELLKRYPYLAHVPHDAPDGKDSPLPPPPPIVWNEKSVVIPIKPPPPGQPKEQGNAGGGAQVDEGQEDVDVEKAEEVEAEDDEEEGVEADDDACTWHDVALSIAAELMAQIRHNIHMKLGYTTSAVRPSPYTRMSLISNEWMARVLQETNSWRRYIW